MDSRRRGWLEALVRAAVAPPVSPSEPGARVTTPWEVAKALPIPRTRARLYLRMALRDFGQLTRAGEGLSSGGSPGVFSAVVRELARLSSDLAALLDGGPRGTAGLRALVPLAAALGAFDLAQELHELLSRKVPAEPSQKWWRALESRFEEREASWGGDPYYGLVLHWGAILVDASLVGRLAIDYFHQGSASWRRWERRQDYAQKQKAVLVEVLCLLSVAERQANYSTRRAIYRQVRELGLSNELTRALRARVKQSFERPRPVQSVVADVRGTDLRRLLLEQALLASLVDGHRSRREREFLARLGTALRYAPEAVTRIEAEMGEHYARNRQLVDAFTDEVGGELLGEEWVDSMQRSVERTYERLLVEARETKELSVLLARVARGQALSDDEKRRMRAQLIDLAKAIPALAIFAAPGGVLLLIALAKVLPFNMLPSAFIEGDGDGEREPDPAEPRGGHGGTDGEPPRRRSA